MYRTDKKKTINKDQITGLIGAGLKHPLKELKT